MRKKGIGTDGEGVRSRARMDPLRGTTQCQNRAAPSHGRVKQHQYRVWIATISDWRPRVCTDVPLAAVALEPAEEGTMSARKAARYVQAFNRAVLGGTPKVWAIALPVVIRYDGDPVPGQRFVPLAS